MLECPGRRLRGRNWFYLTIQHLPRAVPQLPHHLLVQLRHQLLLRWRLPHHSIFSRHFSRTSMQLRCPRSRSRWISWHAIRCPIIIWRCHLWLVRLRSEHNSDNPNSGGSDRRSSHNRRSSLLVHKESKSKKVRCQLRSHEGQKHLLIVK